MQQNEEMEKLANAAGLVAELAEAHGIDIDDLTEQEADELLGMALGAIESHEEYDEEPKTASLSEDEAVEELLEKSASLVVEHLKEADVDIDDLSDEEAEALIGIAAEAIMEAEGYETDDDDDYDDDGGEKQAAIDTWEEAGAAWWRGVQNEQIKQAKLVDVVDGLDKIAAGGIKGMWKRYVELLKSSPKALRETAGKQARSREQWMQAGQRAKSGTPRAAKAGKKVGQYGREEAATRKELKKVLAARYGTAGAAGLGMAGMGGGAYALGRRQRNQ